MLGCNLHRPVRRRGVGSGAAALRAVLPTTQFVSPRSRWEKGHHVPLSDETIEELLALAGVALAHDQLGDALDEICRIAARAIPNADGTTLTSFDSSGPTATAASSEWARELDELQYVEHEGPCIDAAR